MLVVGRREETEVLRACWESDRPEFVAVYGRRRVGKTYLVRETFRDRFAFYATGVAQGTMRDQLDAFAEALGDYGAGEPVRPVTWMEAFRLLKAHLIAWRKPGKKVVFLDELPWMDTHKSRFLPALEWFWNSWVAGRPDILLIVCGLATSWLVKKIFRNRGGLYNRVTRQLAIHPFTLAECAAFAEEQGLLMNRQDLLEAYMIFGGIPFYWSMLDQRFSLRQNVSRLCFAERGALRHEFDNLFPSLFANSDDHVTIVHALARLRRGLTYEEIVTATGLPDGGGLTRRLAELEQSGFLRTYRPFGRKRRGTMVQLTDPFTLFHLTFIEDSAPDEDFWTTYAAEPGHAAWSGYAFERVCFAHIPQIKEALGIAGVRTTTGAWTSTTSTPGAQIDLVIDRNDRVVNLCEMKFAPDRFAMTNATVEELRRQRTVFAAETGTTKAIHLTMVTTFGLTRNAYAGFVQSSVTADDLFR